MKRHSEENLESIIILCVAGGNQELQARAEAALAEKRSQRNNQTQAHE